jgi:hypothetical protein
MTSPTHRDTIYHIYVRLNLRLPQQLILVNLAMTALSPFWKQYLNPSKTTGTKTQQNLYMRHSNWLITMRATHLSGLQLVLSMSASLAFTIAWPGCRVSSAKWMDPGCVPVAEILGTNYTQRMCFCYDVGGGNGYDIAELYQKHPNLPGRLTLQDLPDVIASVKDLPKPVEPMAYDFFTEQPIKGKNFIFSSFLRS